MSLHTLFSPASIAVIGASTRPGSVGNAVAKNIVKSDFTGRIWLVNPKGGTLFDQPCFPTLAAIPDPIDLAIIVVPARIVPQVLREVGEKNIPTAVILSAGFKETGPSGEALEKEVCTLAATYQIEILGPNCLGFIHPKLHLNASFASVLPADGSIAFFSQSGALTSAFLDQSRERLGFSTFVSIGNKATIDENKLLAHFAEDPATAVIGMYTESLTDAPRLIELGQTLLHQKKPVIALKSGTTTAGTQASSSHTGAVAGSDAAYSALFRQARITRAHNFQDLLDLLAIFSQNPLPRGNRVAIVTNAGGLGVLATDACIENGLTLAALEGATVTTLQGLLPSAANCHNPIDILGDALAERYAAALELVARDPQVDLLLVILTPQMMTQAYETAATVLDIRERFPRLPIATVFSGHTLVAQGIEALEHGHIPNFLSPERAGRALGALHTTSQWQMHTLLDQSQPSLLKPETIKHLSTRIEDATAQGTLQWGATATNTFLRECGFPLLATELVTDTASTLRFARTLGRPFALKIESPDIIHKSDVGGVRLNIQPEQAASAYTELIETVTQRAPGAHIQGALAVEMAPANSLELLLGLKREPGLGTLVVIGLGGIYVEVFKDISLRFAPLSATDQEEMLTELKSAPLLQGARGKIPVDLDQLRHYLRLLSDIAVAFPDIVELDINPLAIAPDGKTMQVLDARLRLEPQKR